MKSKGLFVLLVWLCACSPLGSTPHSPTLSPIPVTPPPASEVQKVVEVSLRVRGSTLAAPQIEAGSAQVAELGFTPLVQTIRRGSDGTVLSVSSVPWENAPLAEMRYCFSSQGRPCLPPDDPVPFQTGQASEFQVDWLGPRSLYLWAEFRDREGGVVPAVRPYHPNPQGDVEVTLSVSGVVSPGVKVEGLPAPVQTALAATRAAYPLSGGVAIEDGRCCAGGKAGTTVQLKVDFTARTSEGAPPKEMKVQPGGSGCVKDPAELKGAWEPYQPGRTYEARLALNWLGWWVSVQYRDAAGNLSPIYCDDISLEGNP